MSQIEAGIYLESKQGTIGTGSTAKTQEYRNFWMTIDQVDDMVHCVLLDNDFNLTPLKESFQVADFESGRFTFIPQGEKRHQRLLKKIKAPAPVQTDPPKTQAPAAGKKDQAGRWWEKAEKDVQPGDIFKKDSAPAGAKRPRTGGGNWWESGQKPVESEDIFKVDSSRRQVPKAKPKKKTETVTKKSWWES